MPLQRIKPGHFAQAGHSGKPCGLGRLVARGDPCREPVIQQGGAAEASAGSGPHHLNALTSGHLQPRVGRAQHQQATQGRSR